MKGFKTLLKLILYVVLLLLVCTACISDSKSIERRPSPTSSVCINIKPQQLTDYLVFDFYKSERKPLLFGYNSVNSSLDVFSLAERSLTQTVPLSRIGPAAVNDVVAIKVISPEVVWFATLNELIVYDIKLNAVRQRISLVDLNDKFSLARYAYFFENHGGLVALNDSSVLVQAGFFPLYNGSSSLHLSVLNVNNGEISPLPARLPHWVNAANHFGALNTIQYGYSDGEVYFNLPFSDSLYRYGLIDEHFLPARQYDSPDLPTVLSPYRGGGEMEALIDYASSSSFYMGFQRVAGQEGVLYRFVVIASDEEPVAYTTMLEAFEGRKIILRQEICKWCKTRSFSVVDTVFMFKEGTSERELCFEKILISSHN